jgi:hypothetical protein
VVDKSSRKAGSPLHAVQLRIHENGAHESAASYQSTANPCHRRSETAATVNTKFASVNRSRRRQLAGIKMERVDADHSSVEFGIRL